MIPLPLIPWKLIGAVVGVAAVAFAGYRVNTWHDSHKALKAAQAELAAEVACKPATACHRRAEAWAAQAKLDAEKAAQEALEKAQAAEEAAKKDAAAWRARYKAALATDPGCKAWAESPVSCPL